MLIYSSIKRQWDLKIAWFEKKSIPSGVVVGRKVSVGTVSTSSSPSKSQTSIPLACPAAIATPRAVMSGTIDLTARVCKNKIQINVYQANLYCKIYAYIIICYSRAIYSHTGVPHKSACSCIRRLLVDIIPSAFNFVNGYPQSLCIASRISLVWKQTASRAALIMCCFVVNAVSPQIILRKKKLFTLSFRILKRVS